MSITDKVKKNRFITSENSEYRILLLQDLLNKVNSNEYLTDWNNILIENNKNIERTMFSQYPEDQANQCKHFF